MQNKTKVSTLGSFISKLIKNSPLQQFTAFFPSLLAKILNLNANNESSNSAFYSNPSFSISKHLSKHLKQTLRAIFPG